MKSINRKIGILVPLLVGLALPAMAARLVGVIVDTKEVDFKEHDQVHKVLLVRTTDGSRAVVDMGPVDDMAPFALDKGREVRLDGRLARVGGRPVLMAAEGEIDGRQVQVQRPLLPRAEARLEQRRPSRNLVDRDIEGRVVREKIVRFANGDRAHRVVMLETDRGEAVVADLGPEEALQGVPVRKGKELQVQGRLVNVSDHLVLMANQVHVDGRTVPIERRDRPKSSGADAKSSGAAP